MPFKDGMGNKYNAVAKSVLLRPGEEPYIPGVDNLFEDEGEESPGSPTPPDKEASPAHSRDVIPGTKVTHARLQSEFPFGYVVFSKKEGRLEYTPLPSEKMKYVTNWDKVQIIPDFSNGTVKWIIPKLDSTNTDLKLLDNSTEVLGSLSTNAVALATILIPLNQPVPFVATLSNDQRFPVFVLGFRISSKPTTP